MTGDEGKEAPYSIEELSDVLFEIMEAGGLSTYDQNVYVKTFEDKLYTIKDITHEGRIVIILGDEFIVGPE